MDIKSLIPQRDPIIMIDEIINHSDEETTTALTILKTNIFVEANNFQSSGMIEHIAQSSAARMGMQTAALGKKPLLGYIASVKNLSIHRLPEVGETLNTEIIVTNQINNIVVLKGETKVKGTLVSRCELKVFIKD